MRNYDFHELSPIDFELLTQDVLQARDGVIFQSFKVGRDRGVDLRFASDRENRVVQCKHLRKSGYRALLRQVREEAQKLGRMRPKPTRYYLVTSVELSNDNKIELAEALGLRTTADILGCEDLNNLLGLYPHVERDHYKLWLASTEILQRVLHNQEAGQSQFEFQRIRAGIQRFVQGRSYDLAKHRLDSDRILILSGLPGVGKTTIAEFLLYGQFAEGFEPVIARNSLQEAGNLWREGIPQIFYYDDFLGATFLGDGGAVFARNEDRVISDFIARVAGDETKMLILTTREHILAEAVSASERLKHASISAHRYVVKVSDYHAYERARILYNHAYFNGLNRAYLDQLLKDDFFVDVISHPKFSPRLIEWITTPGRLSGCDPKEYQTFARRLLDNPAEIWDYAYKRQVNHAARSMLLAVYSLGSRCTSSRLPEAFEILHRQRAERYRFQTSADDFQSAMHILSGSFITIGRYTIEFIDPSVRDLMNVVLMEANENCIDILSGAVDMIQIETVWRLAEHEKSGSIRRLLTNRFADWRGGLMRGLHAVDTYTRDGRTWTVAHHLDERLSLLVKLSAALEVDAIRAMIPQTAERVAERWNEDRPNFPVVMEALRGLVEAEHHQIPELVSVLQQLRSALIGQRNYDLSPDDVGDLLDLEPDLEFSPPEKAALQLASEGWRRRAGDWLRDCQSEAELRGLQARFVRLASALDVNLFGIIALIETEISMYGEPLVENVDPWESAYEEAWERAWRRAPFDGLFDSLRQEPG